MAQERKKRKRRRRGFIAVLTYLLFIIGLSTLLAAVAWVAADDVLALNKAEHSAVIQVEQGFTFDEVVDDLKDSGIIENKFLFQLFASITGSKEKVTAGSYALDTTMDYRAILTNLSASSVSRQEIEVTIPEGYNLAQIFQLLEDNDVSTVALLNETAASHNYNFSFLVDLPLGDPNRLEGYLFPDTYRFYVGEDPLYVINKMLVRFDELVTDDMRETIAEMGMTVHEIVIIASMIEKETDGTDRTNIASVIYNRLNNTTGETAGFLNIDATIQYVLPEGQTVTQSDYESVDSLYNTYKYKGLPPGPIANPGIASIRSAISPADTNYYYYVLGNDGLHQFSTTYAEHQQKLASILNENS